MVDECLQLFGGYGYMNEYPIARMFRDARVQRIYGGTNEIMKLLIAGPCKESLEGAWGYNEKMSADFVGVEGLIA